MRSLFALLFLLSCTIAGSAQWTKLFTIEDNNISNPYIVNDKIFVLGEFGKVYSSTDNVTFQELKIVDYNIFQNIFFLDQNVGFITGGCYFPFDECPSNTIFKTSDGGLSWTKIDHPSLFDNNSNGLGTITIFKYLNENEFVIIKEFPFVLLKINISTQSADTLQLPENTKNTFEYNDGSDFSKDDQWIINLRDKEENNNRIYESIDHGLSWREIMSESEIGSKINFAKVLPNGNIYVASNDQTAYIIANGNTIKITAEGLPDFTLIAQFINNQVGYLVHNDNDNNFCAVLKTEDGGSSWYQEFRIDSSFITDMYFSEDDKGALISQYNTLYFRDKSSSISSEDHSRIKIFPNPTSDIVTIINSSQETSYKYKIFDMVGREMQKGKLMENTINISNLPQGVYQLSIIDHDKKTKFSSKIIKL